MYVCMDVGGWVPPNTAGFSDHLRIFKYPGPKKENREIRHTVIGVSDVIVVNDVTFYLKKCGGYI